MRNKELKRTTFVYHYNSALVAERRLRRSWGWNGPVQWVRPCMKKKTIRLDNFLFIKIHPLREHTQVYWSDDDHVMKPFNNTVMLVVMPFSGWNLWSCREMKIILPWLTFDFIKWKFKFYEILLCKFMYSYFWVKCFIKGFAK